MTARRLGVTAAVVDGERVPGDVAVDDGRVIVVGRAPAGSRGTAVPGLVDLHVHGCGGVDFLTADPDGYHAAGRRLLAAGVTAYQPAFATAPAARLRAALATLRTLGAEHDRGPPDGEVAPRVLGAHLEGPFLAANRLGTHDPGARREPDAALLAELLDTGPVGELTLAPELPGATDLVDLAVDRGVVVSLGHTDATAAQAAVAFDHGARCVTHLFNAMRPLHHREPGVAGWALARDGVFVEVVVDGHHLHGDVVRTIWKAAAGRVVLVSDGTAAAGMPDGTYTLGGSVVTRSGGAVHDRDGRLAGSALTLLDAVRNLHALGVPLTRAVDAATRVPARLLGRADVGQLRVGATADIVVVDDRLDVRATLLAGTPVHDG